MDRKEDARKIGTYPAGRITRRDLLGAGAAALMAGVKPNTFAAPAVNKKQKPNILFIVTDQQGLDTISASGCKYANTPNMDRLVRAGVSFSESYCTNPLCSPSRSSLFTGRMPSETGVITNNVGIPASIPNMGQWFGQHGYECVYSGKWHLWHPQPYEIPGFKVLPTGMNTRGAIGDSVTSRVCRGYIMNRTASKPFLLVASFLQPHDICGWVSQHANAPDVLPYPEIAYELPPLPGNFDYDPHAPFNARNHQGRIKWSKQQWRYYLWSYFRQVEMVDAEIGRLLDALDQSGHADNTLIVFTSDHGEGMARHQTALKNFLYDEAAKVPMIVAWPKRLRQNVQDKEHLVSGLDAVSTICDYAGIDNPPKARGRSLRPLLEGKSCKWREFLAAEVVTTGRMIRTAEYKYVTFANDPVRQLFDMANDPGETKNLIRDAKYASVIADHKKMLQEWENKLEPPPTS